MKSDLPFTPSRRDWIRSAGAVALAIATPGWLAARPVINPLVKPPEVGALQLLDLSLAESMIGDDFEMVSTQGHAICRLWRVAGSRRGAGKARKSFSMDFRPISRLGELLQDTYLVHHPVLGTFDLFLVPHTNDLGELTLLATFSRI